MLQREFQQREELRGLPEGYDPIADLCKLQSRVWATNFFGFKENDDGDILQGDASRDD